MTTIHTTPTGAKVHLSAQHAALLHPDDVAQQAHFMTLGAAGHDEAVQREVAAAHGQCGGAAAGASNMSTTIHARSEDLDRRQQLDDLAAAHRCGEMEARVYAAQVSRATADERCETMVRRTTRMRTSACE